MTHEKAFHGNTNQKNFSSFWKLFGKKIPEEFSVSK
jgi:hypothetical protein